MIREKDIEIQCFLASPERIIESGIFLLKIIHAKRVNLIALTEHGLLSDEVNRSLTVTPQEELFASFFRSEKLIVSEMSILELRAHREELSKIAFEARARLTAVDDEERHLDPVDPREYEHRRPHVNLFRHSLRNRRE